MNMSEDKKMIKLLYELREYNINDTPIKYKNITIYTFVNTICIGDKERKEQPVFQLERWEDFVSDEHKKTITDIVEGIVKERREAYKKEQEEMTGKMSSWLEQAMEALRKEEK